MLDFIATQRLFSVKLIVLLSSNFHVEQLHVFIGFISFKAFRAQSLRQLFFGDRDLTGVEVCLKKSQRYERVIWGGGIKQQTQFERTFLPTDYLLQKLWNCN